MIEYRAFISYSHADIRLAAWLQKQLESFPVDKEWVGRYTKVWIVPSSLHPIFRDRLDLPPGPELNDSIKDTIQNSKFLLVLCSPAAAKSEHVNNEIIHFINYHGKANILPVI